MISCKKKMANMTCDKLIHAVVTALIFLVLVEADRPVTNTIGPVRPQHNMITLLGLGKRMSQGDTKRSEGTERVRASEECVLENEKFVNINPFLSGLLDSGETDDVQYDDYYYYYEETECNQNEIGDIFCDFSEFTDITQDNCVNLGGSLYKLSAFENCIYAGDEQIEILTYTSNIFICLGSTCNIGNVVHELNDDAEASWSETQCTLTISHDGEENDENSQSGSSYSENSNIQTLESSKGVKSKGTKGNKGKASKSVKKSKSKKEEKSTKKAPKRRN